MGIWNTIYQVVLILALMLYLHRARWGYLASFLVVAVSSVMIDQFSSMTAELPELLWVRLCCYFGGLLVLSAGISLLATCKLPVMPTNLFVREIAEAKQWSFGRFKFYYDIACLTFSAVVGFVFTGETPGVGWGTLLSVFSIGPLINIFISVQKRFIAFDV